MNNSEANTELIKKIGYKLPEALIPLLKDTPDPFLSFLAHEIRNPLTNIKLSVDILEHSSKESDRKIYLDIIMRSTVRINEIINEVIKYHDADDVATGECSIHQILDEVLTMAEDRIRLKNIMVRKNYADDCKIILNRPKMKIALTNIIINAIDAMTAEKGELKLVTRSGKSRYVVQIEDNGCGISKANMEHIFQAYFTNKPGGLGLGLATTNAILNSNNVEVKVESDEGKGTRFILTFKKGARENAINGSLVQSS